MIKFDTVNYKNYYSKEQTHKTIHNDKHISFEGKQDIFVFHGKVLKRNGKNFSGMVNNFFADGAKLVMEYSDGILQRAKKFGQNKLKILKFTNTGEEVIEKTIPRKVLFEKEYKYSSTGELMQVIKDGKSVYLKEYEIDKFSPVPITRSINKGEIIEFFDSNFNRLSMAIPDKYIKSDFREINGVKVEIRYDLDRAEYQNLYDNYRKGIDLPNDIPIIAKISKVIAKNPKSQYVRTQVTVMNNFGMPDRSYALDANEKLTFYTQYKYNKDGLLVKKSTEYPNATELNIYDNTGLPIVQKVLDKKDNTVLRLTLRKFDPETRIQISEKSTFNYPVEHIKVTNNDHIENGIQYSEYSILHTDSNLEYKRIARIDCANDRVLEQKYYAPDKTEITEEEFVKANRI